MKMKVFCIFAAVLLVLSMAVSVGASESGAAASLGSATAVRGETVTLTVSLSGAPAVQAGGVSVSYDENVLELVSGAWQLTGTLMADFGGQGVATEGVFVYSSAKDINGDILTLTFKVKDAATFDDTCISCELLQIPATCTDGVITVVCDHRNAAAKQEIASDCMVQGYAAGTYCPDCEAYTSGGERLPLADHGYGDWSSDGDATHTRVCTVCTVAKQTVGHVFDEWVNNGDDHNKICTDCGHSVTEAHSFGDWVKVDDDEHKRACVCGEEELAAHDWPADWSDNGDDHHKVCPSCGAEKTSAHNFSDWAKLDADKHSRTCADCGKNEVVAHIYDDACDTGCNVCDHTREIEHDYKAKWSKDKTGHWHACSVCGNKTDFAEHTPGAEPTEYDDQTCTVCHYVIAYAYGHTHYYASTWSSDANSHWHACSGCGEPQNKSAHSYKNACDTDCDVCGYTRETTHAYKTEWSKDAEKHWYECSVCGDKQSEAAHTPGTDATETTDQVCPVCGYVIAEALGHTHNYSTAKSDDTNHWSECACGDKKDVAAHSGGIATCEAKAKCSTCNTEYGELAEHQYSEATCTEKSRCSVCGIENGELAEHKYSDATCTEKSTCSVCGAQTGELAEHKDADNNGKCDACDYRMSTDEPVVDDPVTPDTPEESQAEGLSGGMIAIIVVGAVVILGGGFALVKFTLGRKKIR